jgi:acylphosphatase
LYLTPSNLGYVLPFFLPHTFFRVVFLTNQNSFQFLTDTHHTNKMSKMGSSTIKVAILFLSLWSLTAADDPLLDVAFDGPPGWRMVDRFAGFRFELKGNVIGVGMRQALTETAEELGCFGWVQNTARRTVVGEVRCSKAVAPQMKEWMKRGPEGAQVDSVIIKDYENTKIKLHFSHFKILPDNRETCFRDEPHQCAVFRGEESQSQSAKSDL